MRVITLVKDKMSSHKVNRKNWKGVRYTKDIMKRDFCSRTLNQVIIE